MGELQWALLIVCVVLVVALYVLSRRAGANIGDAEDKHTLFSKRESSGNQMDLLSPPPDGEFDEYGVGRKRTRGANGEYEDASTRGSSAVREPPDSSMNTLLHPLPGQAPVSRRKAESEAPRQETAAGKSAAADDQKLIALIVAPTEETDILGPQLHDALREQGLAFGEGQVYHRTIGSRIIFSVSSLLKPGTLIPEQAESFSTKGLTVVLSLPGPVQPAVALDDMLVATRALAAKLKCDIYDARRERLDEALEKALRKEVDDWATATRRA